MFETRLEQSHERNDAEASKIPLGVGVELKIERLVDMMNVVMSVLIMWE